MGTDEMGMLLHDRATLGEVLTLEEQFRLDAWYAEKDAEEALLLKQENISVPDLQLLQQQLALALTQLASTSEQLQQINSENQHLRQDIRGLKQRLVIPRSA